MAQITYADKSTFESKPSIPTAQNVQAADMNEIKTVVNDNQTEFEEFQTAVANTYVPKILTDGSNVVTRDQSATGTPYIYDSVTDGTTGSSIDIGHNTITIGCFGTKSSFYRADESGVIKSGTEQIDVSDFENAGIATLVAGTVTVNTNQVTANSLIFLSVQSLGTVTSPKAIAVTARTASTSFTITSEDVTDTSVIAWEIKEIV